MLRIRFRLSDNETMRDIIDGTFEVDSPSELSYLNTIIQSYTKHYNPCEVFTNDGEDFKKYDYYINNAY